MRGYRSEALEVLRGTQRGTGIAVHVLHSFTQAFIPNCAIPDESDIILFDLSVCLTSHATIFQLYM